MSEIGGGSGGGGGVGGSDTSGGPGPDEIIWRPPGGGVNVALWWLGRGLFRLGMRPIYRLRVEGREHLPERGGVLLVSNHLDHTDPPFLAAGCMPRPLRYLALARHFTGRPLAWLLSGLGAVPLMTDRPDPRAIRYARERLAGGDVFLIFPEGHPTFGSELAPFQPGVGHLALTPGIAVVPAAIWGSHRVLRGRLPLGRGPVRVRFGPAVPVPAEGSRRERAEVVTGRLREAVGGLVAALAEERP